MRQFFYFPIILCTFLLPPGNVRGQGFGVGVKSGINFANLSLSSEAESSVKLGLYGGIFFSWRFKKLKIKPEILYSQQGLEGINLNSPGGVSRNAVFAENSDLKLNYLNFPLMVEWQFTPEFHVNAGPQLSLLLSAKEEKVTALRRIKTTEDIKGQLKSSDVGLGFGAGFDFPFGLGIDIRYTLGLSNIDDSGFIDLKNRVLMLGFSYSFIK